MGKVFPSRLSINKLEMKNVLIALIALLSLVFLALLLWPGEAIEFTYIRAKTPFGWKVVNHSEGSNADILMYPRVPLLGLGIVKIITSECGNPSSEDDLLRDLQTNLPNFNFRTEIVNGRVWIRSQTIEEGNVIRYSARTILKNGQCLRVLGDPAAKFDDVLSSIQF